MKPQAMISPEALQMIRTSRAVKKWICFSLLLPLETPTKQWGGLPQCPRAEGSQQLIKALKLCAGLNTVSSVTPVFPAWERARPMGKKYPAHVSHTFLWATSMRPRRDGTLSLGPTRYVPQGTRGSAKEHLGVTSYGELGDKGSVTMQEHGSRLPLWLELWL